MSRLVIGVFSVACVAVGLFLWSHLNHPWFLLGFTSGFIVGYLFEYVDG